MDCRLAEAEPHLIRAMNSEYKRLWQEVGCGTRTAQIIYDLGPGQFAAT